jgi:methylmalonyl-CoA/ethylmalonyl-CoA epimerase
MLKLAHIGIAVKSIEKTLPFYQNGLGLTIHPVRSEHDKKAKPFDNLNASASDASNGASIEEVPAMKVKTAKLSLDNTVLELVEPLAGEEAVTKFLEKRGEGIHHICFEVEDIKEMMKQLEAKGYKPLYAEPRTGAGGHLVNFLSPKDTSGVLIEISQEK